MTIQNIILYAFSLIHIFVIICIFWFQVRITKKFLKEDKEYIITSDTAIICNCIALIAMASGLVSGNYIKMLITAIADTLLAILWIHKDSDRKKCSHNVSTILFYGNYDLSVRNSKLKVTHSEENWYFGKEDIYKWEMEKKVSRRQSMIMMSMELK